jgi:hypothetical protein
MPLPVIDTPTPFPEYAVEGVGTVIAHDGDSYMARTDDGRLIGWRAESGTPTESNAAADFSWSAANPRPAEVPASVTRRQLFLALNASGVTRSAIRAQISTEEGLIEYDEASTFDRAHPLVAALATALGMTTEQVDDLYRSAATL